MRAILALLLSLLLAPAWAQVPMTGAGKGTPAFTPSSLSPAWWMEARDYPNWFQSNSGSGAPPASDGDVIGWIRDLSGNSKTLTSAADNATRPTLAGTATKPSITCTAANSTVVRNTTGLNSYNAGASSWFFAAKSNSPGSNTVVSAEGNSGTTTPLYETIISGGTATTLAAFIRNDSSTTILSSDLRTSTWDGSNHVVGVVDDGSGLTPYFDGVAGTRVAYTRSGSITADRFAVCALVRTSAGSFWNGSIYAGVIVNRTLTSTEIADLNTYLSGLF